MTDRTKATGWGAMVNAWFDLGGGSSFGANVGYSQDAAGFVTGSFAGTGIGHGYGTWWGGQVTGKLAVSSNVAIVADLAGIWGPGQYVHSNSGPNVYNGKGGWFGALGVQWYPTAASELGLEVDYTDAFDDGAPSDGLIRTARGSCAAAPRPTSRIASQRLSNRCPAEKSAGHFLFPGPPSACRRQPAACLTGREPGQTHGVASGVVRQFATHTPRNRLRRPPFLAKMRSGHRLCAEIRHIETVDRSAHMCIVSGHLAGMH